MYRDRFRSQNWQDHFFHQRRGVRQQRRPGRFPHRWIGRQPPVTLPNCHTIDKITISGTITVHGFAAGDDSRSITPGP